MKTLILCILLIALSSGCAVQKSYGSSGGSKADGIVKMSYSYGGGDVPSVDPTEALGKAIKRCKVWGYTNAESFEYESKVCQASNQYGCVAWMVTKEYQCTD